MRLTGDEQLYFYDAIAPIVAADSIDQTVAFRAARYDKGGDDYLNCPLDEGQARVLRLIPGLARAEFLQYGQIHRNTYIRAPRVLAPTLRMRAHPSVFFAGQISGVEGYVESVATGWLAGVNAARLAADQELVTVPPQTATGALARYVSAADPDNYQPVNITF